MADNQSIYPQTDVKDYSEKVEAIPGNTETTIKEDDLLKIIKRREQACSKFYNDLKQVADQNKNYYIGNQVDDTNLFVGESGVVVNKILPAIETIIPIVTEKAPEPDVTITPSNRKNRILQEKIERKLHDSWNRELDMQKVLEKATRNLSCNRYVAFKIYYDQDRDDYGVALLPAGKIFFSEHATSEENLPFVGEYCDYTVGELIEKFATDDEGVVDEDMADKIKAEVGYNTESVGDDSIVTIIEYWEQNFVAWKYKNLILGFEQNPFWNWEDQEFNHLKAPCMPYFFVNLYNFGESIVDPVSQVELIKSVQDNINKRKRQIEQNASMANGKYVFAGNRISKESAAAINNDPNEKIFLDQADTTDGAISILTGRAYDQGIYVDMQDSKAEIDNIIGAHGTTRGERGATETALGRQILKSGDISRQRTFIRAYEGLARRMFNYFVQCMFVYYDEKHPLQPNRDKSKASLMSAVEHLEFIQRDEFRDLVIQVEVIDGSIVPKDKDAQKAEALQLAQQKMMSLLDMYKILEYPDPEKMARNAIMEQADPMFLYGEVAKGDNLDFEAIRNLRAIQYNNTGEELPIIYDVPDLKLMTRYLDTITAYLKGEEIHQELIPFSSLAIEAQEQVMNHYKQQLDMTEVLANENLIQEGGMPGEENMPPMEGMPPVEGGGQPPINPEEIMGGAGMPGDPIAGQMPPQMGALPPAPQPGL